MQQFSRSLILYFDLSRFDYELLDCTNRIWMKVLFNCHTPFMLAHGGAQTQIEQTIAALTATGVETDYLEWWNDRQNADILHHFGFAPLPIIRAAQEKKWKFVNTDLFTETCNRSDWGLLWRRVCIRSALRVPLPGFLGSLLYWKGYQLSDQMIVGLEAERELLQKVYGVRKRVAVVPLGLTETFLKAGPPMRTADHLVCTGRIGPSKNSLELASLAVAAKVPLLFVGKPLNAQSPYWLRFRQMADGKYVKHHEHVGSEREMVPLLQKARGFVLMSRYENWSLAAHEAAACGLPLLLPDQRWARERFGDQASYFPKRGMAARAAALRKFYEQAPNLSAPKVRLYSWLEVAEQLRDVYGRLLGRS